jgi:hypothetical protein
VWTRFAARGDIAAELALPDLAETRWQINQHPVEEIDPRQRRWYGAVFLIDVVALARHVGIMADDGKRLG